MSQGINKSRRYLDREVDGAGAKAPGCHGYPLQHRRDVPARGSRSREILPFGSRYRRLPPQTHLFIEGEGPEGFLVVVAGSADRQKLR